MFRLQPQNLICMLRISILAPRVSLELFSSCVYVQRAERCCKTRFAVDIMSYQYNYNHFEPCYSNYGYPWMPVAAPGLGSTLHTAADRGNEPSCSTKTSHYTVALKIFSPLNKREYQQHSLRNIDPKVISTAQELKEEVKFAGWRSCSSFSKVSHRETKKEDTKQRRP